MAALKKPAYRLTRQAFWVSFALAWMVIVALVWGALSGRDGAVQIVPVALPSMVALIAALLGIHRAFGSMDMRTVAERTADEYSTRPGIPPRVPPDAAFTEGGQ